MNPIWLTLCCTKTDDQGDFPQFEEQVFVLLFLRQMDSFLVWLQLGRTCKHFLKVSYIRSALYQSNRSINCPLLDLFFLHLFSRYNITADHFFPFSCTCAFQFRYFRKFSAMYVRIRSNFVNVFFFFSYLVEVFYFSYISKGLVQFSRLPTNDTEKQPTFTNHLVLYF